jgi:CheY-like chemotaxis protein
MDLQMPVMGGFEATAAIRERERRGARRVRIVAMTAHSIHGDRERCLAAGMDGYVTKPIDPRVLCAAVEEEGPAPAGAAVDRGAALHLMGGDEQLLADVIRLFLADCPVRLAAIKTAIDRRDAEQIRREAHGLKGASGNLAATALVDAAKRLEKVAADSRLEGIEAAWLGLSNAAEAVLGELSGTTSR